MNLSPSIDLIWRLAAQEMAAGEFSEIQPEHFCMALLKFAEISVKAREDDGEEAEVAKAIAGDAQLVREALQKCGIEGTSARRKLRRQLGKGSAPRKGNDVHRSAASRALFESAAIMAQESGSDTLTPLHLLTALVQSPTPVVAQAVLGNAVPVPPQAPPAALALLEKHGQDLGKLAAERKVHVKPGLAVQCKAVLQAVEQKDRKSILLVCDSDKVVVDLASALAVAIVSKDAPEGWKRRRVIDVSLKSRSDVSKGKRPSPDAEAAELDLMRQLLAEASAHPEVVLVVPAVEAGPQRTHGGKWTSLLQETLAKGKIQFICRVTPSVFSEHLRKDAVWKQRTQAVWLEMMAQGSVPREL
jgi:ATP-dependent Clp protease ATP-binding subunit ClpA